MGKAKNKEKNNEQTKTNYRKNKKTYRERQRKYREDRANWFWGIKCQLQCKVCGEQHPACLDFHHRNPSLKEGLISKLVCRVSKEKILAEIEKCDVMCANCHRKFHCKREYVPQKKKT